MGTDIHMWAEVRREYPRAAGQQKTEWEAKWHTVGRVFRYPYYNPDNVPLLYEDGGCYGEELTMHPYYERNYDVFAMLADVRNGHGFAGVDTGDGFVPIAAPRGFPPDVSEYVRRQSVDHTPSWVSLDELNAYDWTRTTKHRGVVNTAGFLEFREKGKPTSYSGGVFGASIAMVTNEDMQAIIDGKKEVDGTPYTVVEWEVTYEEAAGSFFTETLPKLREIRAKPGVLDLRIVFFFDS